MSLVGKLEDLVLSDIFQILSIGRKSGILVVKTADGTAFVVFRDGTVIRAEGSMVDGSIKDELLAAGLISGDVIEKALTVKKDLSGKSMPEILHDLGYVSSVLLDNLAKKRIIAVVYYLLGLTKGDFRFEVDITDPEAMSVLCDTGWEYAEGLSVEYLLMESARMHDEEELRRSEETDLLKRGEAVSAGDEGQGGRRDMAALKSFSREIQMRTNNSDITGLLLRFMSIFFRRGVLLLNGENSLTGIADFGYNVDVSVENRIRTDLPFVKDGFFHKLAADKRIFRGTMERDEATVSLIGLTGGDWPQEVCIFPMTIEGRTEALLYCEGSLEDISEIEGIEILVNLACIALEKSLANARIGR